MGLDMYVYKTMANPKIEVDFNAQNFFPEEVWCWRKHPNLHGWMENLYYRKGGKNDSFNCVNVQLTEFDLDILEEDVKNNNLPNTSGFFFGQTDGSERDGDLEFVSKAREAIEKGMTVYYTSWW